MIKNKPNPKGIDKVLDLLVEIAKIDVAAEEERWELHQLIQDCLIAIAEDTNERIGFLKGIDEKFRLLGKSLGVKK